MRAKEFIIESQQATLNQLYNGNFPDRDESFWDEVRPGDFETPLTIHTMPRHKVEIMLLGQYHIEHLDELVDRMDDDQKEVLERYMNDPSLSSKVILISGHRIIDGNHRALAAAYKGVPINYIDLAELDEEEELDEGWKEWAAAGAIGAAALGGFSGKSDQVDRQAPTQPVTVAAQAPAQAKAVAKVAKPSMTPTESFLVKAAESAGIKGPELAQFLAQVKHESWDFKRLKEKPMGKNYFAKKYDPKFAPRTAKILGNTKIGDGEKYFGRGYIQLTGRDNYRMASEALNLPLLSKPELAADPAVAAKIAIWYWNTRVKPHVANFSDTKAVTRKINPAMRGLEDRHENFLDYMKSI